MIPKQLLNILIRFISSSLNIILQNLRQDSDQLLYISGKVYHLRDYFIRIDCNFCLKQLGSTCHVWCSPNKIENNFQQVHHNLNCYLYFLFPMKK